MVKIRQKDFNRELDSYLTDRTNTSISDFVEKIKKGKKKQEKVPEMSGDEVLVEERELTFFEKIFGRKDNDDDEDLDEEDVEELEREYEELDEMEEVIEEKKEGIFSKIIRSLRKKPDVEMYDEEPEEVAEIPDDIKKTLKIINTWLKKLPPSEMMKFRQSEDYTYYKDTLQKYKLIK